MTAPMSCPTPSPEIPEGMRADARETWPSRELIDSFLGTGFDFELRLGEHTPIPIDDPEAAERARQFRDVLGIFATGVTVVTSMSGDEPVGMTCQSFSSVSLEPPLVMFCPAKTSRAWPLMRQAGLLLRQLPRRRPARTSPTGWPPRARRSSTASAGSPRHRGAAHRRGPRLRRLHHRPGPRGRRPLHRGRPGPGARLRRRQRGRLGTDVPLLFHRGAYTQPE